VSTVHRWFLRLSRAGVFERLGHALAMADRERVGREASPSGAVVAAQAARSSGTGVAGERVASATSVAVTIVSASPGQKGFAVHPRRWVIERTGR
jgi:transposase